MRYKPYPKYKDSGVVWLGDVPKGWRILNIKRLCFVKRGASPRPIENPIYFNDNGEYAWVRISDVTLSEMYLEKTVQKLSNLGKSLSVPLEPNDLFLSIAGSVGKPIIANIKCCIHDGFVYFQNYKENLKFLYWVFKSGQPYLGLGKFGTQLNLNKDTVGDIKIGLPSFSEQNQIVEYIEEKTKKIDTLINKQQTLIKLLKEKRQALISHAVTKGLDDSVAMKDSGVEWLGDVPEGWEIWKLSHAFNMIGSGTTPSSTKEEYYNGNIPWVTTGELREKIIIQTKKMLTKRAMSELSSLKIFPKNSIVIAMYGATIGRLGKLGIEATTNQACCVISHSSSILNNYLYYWLLGYRKEIVNLGYGGGQPNISQDTISNLKISAPNFDEQQNIINYLDQKTQKIDTLINKATQAIELLKERRTALISAVVTGKVDVRCTLC